MPSRLNCTGWSIKLSKITGTSIFSERKLGNSSLEWSSTPQRHSLSGRRLSISNFLYPILTRPTNLRVLSWLPISRSMIARREFLLFSIKENRSSKNDQIFFYFSFLNQRIKKFHQLRIEPEYILILVLTIIILRVNLYAMNDLKTLLSFSSRLYFRFKSLYE